MQSKIAIPPELMVVKDATELFSFIAKHIEVFLKTCHQDCFGILEQQRILSLGLTFSYPVYQTAIDSGILLRWTKGFDIPQVVGQDVCRLLQHEIDLLHLPVKITALVNDAAGTIMSRAYTLPVCMTRTSIGAIFGTGTNGVYLEKLHNITKPLEGQYDSSTGEMLVSIEWGSFDNDLMVLPNTSYDMELNEVSLNPGNQMFEKRVSGMFLGELLRKTILGLHLDPESNLFDDHGLSAAATVDAKSSLYIPWSVDSSILSIAEADSSDDLVILRQKIADSMGIQGLKVSVEDARAIKVIGHAIGKRAARLAGMAIGAVVLQSERLTGPMGPLPAGIEALRSIRLNKDERGTDVSSENIDNGVSAITPELTSSTILQEGDASNTTREHDMIDVGVDGSLIEFYPGFETYMREALRDVTGIGAAGEGRIRIGIAKDGSSVGAAIIALLAARNPE